MPKKKKEEYPALEETKRIMRDGKPFIVDGQELPKDLKALEKLESLMREQQSTNDKPESFIETFIAILLACIYFWLFYIVMDDPNTLHRAFAFIGSTILILGYVRYRMKKIGMN